MSKYKCKNIYIEDFESRKIHSIDVSSDGEYFDVNINIVENNSIDTAVTYEYYNLEDAQKAGKRLAKKYNVSYGEYFGT